MKGDTLTAPLREAGVNHSLNGKFAVRQFDKKGNEWKLIFVSGSGGFSSPKGANINPGADISDLSKLRLYNLTTDPSEKKSLLAGGGTLEMQTKARELQKLLERYITSGRSAPQRSEAAKQERDLEGSR